MTGAPPLPPPTVTTMSRLTLCRLVLASVLLATIGLLGASPAQACACGGFVAADGEQVAASAEYAVLSHDGATERVLLSMSTLASTPDAALLIPTPAPAEAALAEPTLFPELERLTAPEEVVRFRWWPRVTSGDTAGAPGAVGGAPVSVLKVRQLGDLEVTTLAASDAAVLAEWLDAHGYVMRDGFAAALQPYVSDGWFYTAIRLTTDADDLTGSLQPLDLTFASDALVYPMRLSAAARASQFVRTFVFDDHRVQRTDPTDDHGRAGLRFAGRIEPTAVTTPTLLSIVAQQPYLTVIDQYFSDPSSQIVSDFTFGQAPSDTPYRRTTYVVRTRTLIGLPAGPVLVAVGVLALNLVVAGVLVWRRRADQR